MNREGLQDNGTVVVRIVDTSSPPGVPSHVYTLSEGQPAGRVLDNMVGAPALIGKRRICVVAAAAHSMLNECSRAGFAAVYSIISVVPAGSNPFTLLSNGTLLVTGVTVYRFVSS